MGSDLTLKDAGQGAKGVYDGDRLIARILHDGIGWRVVDLDGNVVTKQPYQTPELAREYVPQHLRSRNDDEDDEENEEPA
jgi:hypothetical protein